MKRTVFTIILGLSGAFAVWFGFFSPEQPLPQQQTTAAATVISPNRAISDFSLINTENAVFTQKSLTGQWTLMFFGYSQCPEICPKTLLAINELWNIFPAKEKNLEFVFVSLDAKNDNPKDLKSFLHRFNTNFTGLTGNEADIKLLSKSCSIFSWEDTESTTGTKIIDHSATLVLVNPQGKIEAFFSPPHQKELIAKDLHALLR